MAEKKHLLLAISNGDLGGGQETVRLLAQHLDPSRFQVSVACPDSPLLKAVSAIPGVRCFPMDFPTIPNPFHVNRLVKILQEEKVDILHTHLFHGDLYGFLANRRARVPALVSTIQGINFFWENADPQRRLRWRATSSIYRTIYRPFHRIAVCSEAVKQAICSRPGSKIDPGKVRVIYNSIDFPQLQTRADQELIKEVWPIASNGHSAPKRIITVANFAPFKGHRVLIEAMRQLASTCDLQCLLVGEGPERRRLEAKTRAAGLSNRIRFLGWRQDVPALLRTSDLFVLPSLWEPFGIAMLEAMSLNIPVVACSAGGIPEIITHGENGFLTPPGDAPALAAGIRYVLENPAVAAEWQTKAAQTVKERFDARTMALAYEQFYLKEKSE